ncbi:MAG: uridine kinase [Simkaniaceae bacterium]|nr:MAG: uridine kinase [Simkaniaceae bacterium]
MEEKLSWIAILKLKFLFLLCFFKPLLFASSIMIGIAGASGAGKTTFATKMKKALGKEVAIICQDSYYKDLSHLSIKERSETNFDAPASIDFDLLTTHLKMLKDGRSIECPVYDFVTHSRTKETVKIEPKDITILEECLILAVPEVRNLFEMKIFVDADMDICLCRRIERGRKFPDIQRQYLLTVRPMFLKHVAPSKAYADLIIPNEGQNEVVLDFISGQLSQMVTPSLTYQTCKGNNDA